MISGFQSSPQRAALSILIFWRLLISRPDARCYADRKSLFTLSNSFDNRGIWPPAAPSLTFAIAKSFFLARFAILALSLACLDCVTSKLFTYNTLIHSRSSLLTQYRHWWERHEKLMPQTAFFEAILKFCTTNKIFVNFLSNVMRFHWRWFCATKKIWLHRIAQIKKSESVSNIVLKGRRKVFGKQQKRIYVKWHPW